VIAFAMIARNKFPENIRRSKTTPAVYMSPTELGVRWRCNKRTAQRRMRDFGAQTIRLTQRSVLYPMAEIRRVEAQAAHAA
jgi:hypothetical protein